MSVRGRKGDEEIEQPLTIEHFRTVGSFTPKFKASPSPLLAPHSRNVFCQETLKHSTYQRIGVSFTSLVSAFQNTPTWLCEHFLLVFSVWEMGLLWWRSDKHTVITSL